MKQKRFENVECRDLTNMAVGDNRNFSMVMRNTEFPIPLHHIVTRDGGTVMDFTGGEEIGKIDKIDISGKRAFISGEVDRRFIESLPSARWLLWLNENGTVKLFRLLILEDRTYPENELVT